MTYDASSRKDIRKAEKAASLAERNRISFVQHIMSQPLGRVWMYDLLAKCHLFGTPYVKDSPDATAFNCGAHNVGLQIFIDVVCHCSQNYILMMQEAAIKEASDARSDPNSGLPPEPTGPAEEPRRDDPGPEPDAYIDDDGFVNWPNGKSIQ